MIKHHFYIPNDKLNECKNYIRSLKTARFIHNPCIVGDKYSIDVSFENSADSNAMNILFNQWEKEKEKNEIENHKSKSMKQGFKLYSYLAYFTMGLIVIAIVFGFLNGVFNIVKR